MENRTETERAVNLMQAAGIVRAKELARSGVHLMILRRLVDRGVVERDGCGIYRFAGVEVSENFSLIQAAKRVPKGVICLLSEQRFMA